MSGEKLDLFLPMVRFMAEMHGADAEIILYDVQTYRVYEVIHPFDEEMKVGSEMRSLEKNLLRDRRYESEEFIVNYRALSRSKDKLKSATLFLKDRESKLVAILTVNQKVDRLIELRNIINELISGVEPYEQTRGGSFYDSFDVSVSEMVTQTMQEEISAFGLPASRLDAKEKMQLIKSLDAKGIFLVKGAVGELAHMLDTTETTVYRYISRMAEESPPLDALEKL